MLEHQLQRQAKPLHSATRASGATKRTSLRKLFCFLKLSYGLPLKRASLKMKYYSFIIMFSQPFAIALDLTINNQLVTILASNLVAVLTAYFYNKYKKN